ncbi:myogenesis-regulating glycosidase-like [Ostrinia furnacalis]|uniref:myogenesis-regulating glycosidase-like n=1 Tax=Ostrinia furnacalis TaxID=93504 RepID=UPI00103E8022|nr:myogenesis-regulating glycosidase-like [Ostrinia furnacalis]
MAVWRSFLTLMTLAARAHPALILPEHTRANDLTLSLEPMITGGFEVILINEDDERKVLSHIGRTLFGPYTIEDIEGGVEVHLGTANLTIHTVYDQATNARGIKFNWDAPANTRLEDCIDFGNKQWYGGPMQIDQLYPIQNAPRTYSAYVSSENNNGAIVERYWLNSAGEYVYVHPEVPLFVDYNNLLANHLCFGAQIIEPYSTKREHTPLSYDIWLLPDVKSAHKHAVANYLGQPSDVPDFRMVQHPIWSTWAQYSRDINGSNLIEFANVIREHGFNNSQFEVDDLWEVCYGSLTVDTNKFPNFTHFVEEIKALDYRVTLWVHPFINKGCDPWYTEALNNGYLVLDEAGSPETTWWNNNGTEAAYIDFTNPAAAEWWYLRVKSLTDTYGIDSFKFDAGESSFAPQVSQQTGDIDLQPHHIVETYVRTCARFGGMVEVRAGFRTQDLPIYVRMVDRDSIWGTNNGLPTIVTTTIQMNLNGYTLVLPDMIGGNGYNLDHEQADLPTKELFIRWVQANTFLPVMQFSFAPWNFDNETVEISKKYTDLHAAYAENIYAAMEASVNHGTPVNGPLWWIAPDDEKTLVIWDEYLLGEDIIVAPVFQEGVRSRDIYLPSGVWLEEGDPSKLHVGPTWLHSHPAPLDTLPFFVRESPSQTGASTAPAMSVLMIVLCIIVAMF